MGLSYRILLNPQPQAMLTPIPWEWRSGLINQANPFNSSPMKVLVWNCRGVGKSNFCRNFSDIIRLRKPSTVVVLETRVFEDRPDSISSNLGFDNVCCSDATGFSGGIWVLWNS
nr:hypothetical protein CFP56_49733 [Quercus suber]